MANNERDAAKEQFWRDVLKRHAASGLSVRVFCLREKLTESAFYAWRRTVTKRDGEAQPTQRASAFVPMMLADRSAWGRSIEMELVGGRILRLPDSITTERLVELVVALEAGVER